MQNPVTIYGASDDLVEFEGAIYGEANLHRTGTSIVTLQSPDGEHMTVMLSFGKFGWEIKTFSGSLDSNAFWPMQFGYRPGDDLDPAIIIDIPPGTTATCDGYPVS